MTSRLTSGFAGLEQTAHRERAAKFRHVGFLGGAILAILAIAAEPRFLSVLPATLLNVCAFIAVHGRLRPSFLSPATLFAGYMSGIGLSSFFFVNNLAGSGGTSGIDFQMTAEMLTRTANLFLLISTVVLISAWLTRGSAKSNLSVPDLLDFGDLNRYRGIILFAAAANLVGAIALSGVGNLMMRPTYIFEADAGFAGTIVSMMSLAAIAALGLVAFGAKDASRFAATTLLALFVLYFVALGTRRLGLIPVILLFSYAIANRGRLPARAIFFAIVGAVVGLALTLHFRNLPLHGLLPHLTGIGSFTFGVDEIREITNNVLVGFRITYLTAFVQPSISDEVFQISVSPFSGTSLGWEDMSRQLRLNTYTPYSAIGEIANHGPLFTAIFFSVLGLTFGLIERMNIKLFTAHATRLYAILVVGLVFLFVVQSIQYNLRSITRYVFFALAVQLVASFIVTRATLHGRRAPAHRR